MEQFSSLIQHQSFQLYLLHQELQLDKLHQNDGEEDAGAKGRRKRCGKVEIYSDEHVFTCSGKFFIRKKSDCIQKSRDTHSYGETRKKDERKLRIRRSVEFSSATERCIPWRADGHSLGETCRYKRRIRDVDHSNLKLGVKKMWQGNWMLKNIYRETVCTQWTKQPGKTKSWKDGMVTRSTRVSSHNSSYASSLLDHQEDLRKTTKWPYEWVGREHGYLGHISKCHSSSSSFNLGQDYEGNLRYVKNNLWNSVEG